MKKKLHKPSSLFLLLLTVLPLAYAIFLNISQALARHEMKERLEKELTITITIPEDEVTWIKDGKEISIDNQLFDIKTSNYKNGYYTFSGLYDDQETQLMKKMNSQNGTGDFTHQILLSKLIQLLFTSYEHPSEFSFTFFPRQESMFSVYNNNSASPTLPIIAPPPKV